MQEVLSYLLNKLENNDTVVLGTSGGPDSMCLLDLLIKIREKKPINIIVAHVHHNVRKESDEEALFVKNYCAQHNCSFEMYHISEYPKTNFHEYARQVRYAFFKQLIKKYQAKYLMTAHHADDLMETILMRLVRGSNLKGYIGFKQETIYENYTLLRPLISVTKQEINTYNIQNKIEYRLDASNFKEKYTRNRYRLHILPFLKAENPQVHQKFLKFSHEMAEIDDYLTESLKDALTKVMVFDKVNVREFNKLHALIKKRVVEYILMGEYQNNLKDITNHHVSLIIELLNSKKSNLTLYLPDNKIFKKSYNEAYFLKDDKTKPEEQILTDEVILSPTSYLKKIKETDIVKSNYLLRLDSKEIALPLKVRYKKDGDKIALKNSNGHQKIKDLFINAKIPLEKRETYPLVVDNNDHILWVPGIKKSKFDKNNHEFYDIIYKYVISEEKKDEK